VLVEDRFRGMSAERVYNLLDEQEEGGNQDQADDGCGDSTKSGGERDEPRALVTAGGIGQVLDAPEPETADGKDVAQQAREWQIAVEQAQTISKLTGIP
jgi:hypothetical protein